MQYPEIKPAVTTRKPDSRADEEESCAENLEEGELKPSFLGEVKCSFEGCKTNIHSYEQYTRKWNLFNIGCQSEEDVSCCDHLAGLCYDHIPVNYHRCQYPGCWNVVCHIPAAHSPGDNVWACLEHFNSIICISKGKVRTEDQGKKRTRQEKEEDESRPAQKPRIDANTLPANKATPERMSATQNIHITYDAVTILTQLGIRHPVRNECVFLIKTERDKKSGSIVVDSMFSIYLGTNCGFYWATQEQYNRADPDSRGWNSKSKYARLCTEHCNMYTVLGWINIFLEQGYAGIFIYTQDDNRMYQYEDLETRANANGLNLEEVNELEFNDTEDESSSGEE